MLPALLALAALFALLFVFRIGAAERAALVRRWPALLLAGAALVLLARGALWPAAALALGAALAWEFWPRLSARRPTRLGQGSAQEAQDLEARAILGVAPDATPDQIRAAYRAKMARAHPDRGGSHAEAARLTAARDRLLGKRR